MSVLTKDKKTHVGKKISVGFYLISEKYLSHHQITNDNLNLRLNSLLMLVSHIFVASFLNLAQGEA